MPGFTPFTSNYSDLSDENGYQFEFRCDICGSGYRSYLAQRILINAGRENVYNVLGGRIVTELVQAARAGGKKKVIDPSS